MDRKVNIMAVVAILIHISFYSIYAFNLEVNKNALDIFYAFGFHFFVLISAIIFKLKIENKIVGALSLYAIIFEIVSVGSFVVMGLFYGENYFYYKAALISSVVLYAVYYLLEKTIKYVRDHIIRTD